jgi:hypothetical protein
MYQEMMRWFSSLLDGVVVGLWKYFRLKCFGKG